MKRRQVKPLAASLLDALDYDSSDDSDFEVGDASGKLFYFFKSFLLKKKKKSFKTAGVLFVTYSLFQIIVLSHLPNDL